MFTGIVKVIQEENKNYNHYEEEELQAVYDSRASFYKKAYVVKNYRNGELIGVELFSYGCKVAELIYMNANNTPCIWYGQNSNTTRRHLREFLKQYSNISYKDIEKLNNFEYVGGIWLHI